MKTFLKVCLPLLAIVAFVVAALMGRPSETATADRQQSERGPVPISLTFLRKEAVATPPFLEVNPDQGMTTQSFSHEKGFGLSWGWVSRKPGENRISVWYRLVALKDMWLNAQFKVGDQTITPKAINTPEKVGNSNYYVGVSFVELADSQSQWVTGRACVDTNNCSEWSDRLIFNEVPGVEPKQIGTINGVFNCAVDFVRFVDPSVSIFDPSQPSTSSPWGKLIGETHLGELEQSKVIDLSDRVYGRQQLVIVSKWEGRDEAVEKIWVNCPDRPIITSTPVPTVEPISIVITGTATTSCADRNAFEVAFNWSGNDNDVVAPLDYQKSQRFSASATTEVRVNVSLRGGTNETWVFEARRPASMWCDTVFLPLVVNQNYVPCTSRVYNYEYISGETHQVVTGQVAFQPAISSSIAPLPSFIAYRTGLTMTVAGGVDNSYFHRTGGYIGEGQFVGPTYFETGRGPVWNIKWTEDVPPMRRPLIAVATFWHVARYLDKGTLCVAAIQGVADPDQHPQLPAMSAMSNQSQLVPAEVLNFMSGQ